MKPQIGINTDYQSDHCVLDSRYFDAVRQAGGVPVTVPPVSQEELDEILPKLDGFIMIGGLDLDCRNDGWHPHHTMKVMHARREAFDRRLVAQLEQRRIPLLAIGVGMQLLAIQMGGELLLNIQDDKPKALPHRMHGDPLHGHIVHLEPDSVVHEVYAGWYDGKTQPEIIVNSLHHQAVDECELADGVDLRVTARCPDGVVEAIEATNGWWAVGVQWHPERMRSQLDLGLFQALVQAAEARRPCLSAA